MNSSIRLSTLTTVFLSMAAGLWLAFAMLLSLHEAATLAEGANLVWATAWTTTGFGLLLGITTFVLMRRNRRPSTPLKEAI